MEGDSVQETMIMIHCQDITVLSIGLVHGYNECHTSNLNGHYFNTSTINNQGITWHHWKGSTTLKFSEMKTRRNN